MKPMLSVQDAKELILHHFAPVSTEKVDLQNVLGRVLSEPIISNVTLPRFDHSSVDGFAVLAKDTANASVERPIELDVIADIPAGWGKNASVHAGFAARIMTGAPIPLGADAVVMVEDTDAARAATGSPIPSKVLIHKPIKSGENIRFQGDDLSSGQVILDPGHKVRPQDVGMLAMLGIDSISVYRKPKVAVFSSGDELVTPGTNLQPGQIFDSNSPMIEALVRNQGCEVVHLGIAKDTKEDVERVLGLTLVNKPDVIISTAGVGTGVYDYIKEVVTSDGNLDFWKVNMRPGKPLAFGNYRGIPFFGLPGNPVSSYVSYQVFAKPSLAILAGIGANTVTTIKVKLGEAIRSDGRESYLRVVINNSGGQPIARMTGHQGSGNLFSTVLANALLIIPSGVTDCPEGSEFEAWLTDQ